MPIHTRYAAPIVLTTLNAVADVARMADNPSADPVAWITHPAQMPTIVSIARRRPTASTLRVTSAMSAPGRIVRSAATPMNAYSRGSTFMVAPVRTWAHLAGLPRADRPIRD